MVLPVLVGGGISIFPADRRTLPLELMSGSGVH